MNYVCFQAARAIEARAERLVYTISFVLFICIAPSCHRLTIVIIDMMVSLTNREICMQITLWVAIGMRLYDFSQDYPTGFRGGRFKISAREVDKRME
jgi:hypothetical protein